MTLSMLGYWILFWPLLASGMLLPGYLVGRIIGTPAATLSSFLGSAIVLFYVVISLDGLGVRLEAFSIGGTVALINLILLGIVLIKRRPTSPPITPQAGSVSFPHGWAWLWLVPPAFGLAAIAVRSVVDPLSGFDNYFRWDFLARQMLHTGTLSFYPPVTSADFTLYAWCDGIPPLVPVLNLWSYLSAHSLATIFIAPRVMLEAGMLFYAVWRLARNLWGAAAGWPAIAALSTSSLLLWGVAMSQETGLTALTLVAMFFFIDEYLRGGGRMCLFWAGVAAGAGALSREYALVWPLFGLLTLAWRGGLRTGWKLFLATSVILAAPWYLRNWLHTGNPLFAQSLGGLFPTNPVHQELAEIMNKLCSISANPGLIPLGVTLIVVNAGVLLTCGVWGFCKAPRLAAPLGVAAGIVGALWIWSISQTAGGWIYSTRVLTPILALAAVLAGGALVRSGRSRCWLPIAFVLIAGDAAMRSLHLPVAPLQAAWTLSPNHWIKTGVQPNKSPHNQMREIIAIAAGSRGIVVDHPVLQVQFMEQGARAVPVFSPQVACMFDEKLSFAATIVKLRTAGLRFVLFSNDNEITDGLAKKHAFLRKLRARQPIFTTSLMSLYDLDLIKP